MTTYRAVICRELGLSDGLALEEVARQSLPPGHLRIRVAAAGLNFPDLLMVQGLYQFKPPLPFVPGMEAAGTVIEAAGTRFKAGDTVFVMARNGAFAEEMAVPEELARPLPAGMSMAEGAGFGVAAITAYHALHTRGGLRPGQTVLVLGASGGVGSATVRMAKAMGATVIAAASSAGKLELARALGADHLIDYAASVLEKEVEALTGGRGVDLIVDPVGWEPLPLCRSIAFGGRILMAGFAGGAIPAYPANRLLLKGASLVGVRAGEAGRHDPALREREWADIEALAGRQDLRPIVSASLPLADFRDALARLQRREAVGRIVLVPG